MAWRSVPTLGRGSGGAGRWILGTGACRAIRTCAILGGRGNSAGRVRISLRGSRMKVIRSGGSGERLTCGRMPTAPVNSNNIPNIPKCSATASAAATARARNRRTAGRCERRPCSGPLRGPANSTRCSLTATTACRESRGVHPGSNSLPTPVIRPAERLSRSARCTTRRGRLARPPSLGRSAGGSDDHESASTTRVQARAKLRRLYPPPPVASSRPPQWRSARARSRPVAWACASSV